MYEKAKSVDAPMPAEDFNELDELHLEGLLVRLEDLDSEIFQKLQYRKELLMHFEKARNKLNERLMARGRFMDEVVRGNDDIAEERPY
jgi:hypothetical protein